MYFNSEGQKEVTYDAIVVGSGISGGWAAKELCEKGLKTLVLERGRGWSRHLDYPTANLETWELPNRNRLTPEEMKDYKIQERTGYTITPAYQHWWPKDTEHPIYRNQTF
jgi:choline dehydrogenase-like flavoprotein